MRTLTLLLLFLAAGCSTTTRYVHPQEGGWSGMPRARGEVTVVKKNGQERTFEGDQTVEVHNNLVRVESGLVPREYLGASEIEYIDVKAPSPVKTGLLVGGIAAGIVAATVLGIVGSQTLQSQGGGGGGSGDPYKALGSVVLLAWLGQH